jgi:hypothetical protein
VQDAFINVLANTHYWLSPGEILAAIQTVMSIGVALSGLVLGSVLSASINTFPGLVFLVYSVRSSSF